MILPHCAINMHIRQGWGILMQSMQAHFEYAYHSFLQAYMSAAKFVDDF
jgi:hypothetical protein